MAATLRTITVGDLINMLKDEDPDALVVFSSDYGDYHHTQQAHGLRGDIEEVKLSESAYSHSGFAVADEDDEDEDEPVDTDGPVYLRIK